MKSLFLAMTLLLVGCATNDARSPFEGVARNMSEAEVRALPDDTHFEDVSERLRYFTRPAVAVPMISFVLHDRDGFECVMFFDRTGLLRYAVVSAAGSVDRDDAAIIWPRSAVGKKLSELQPFFGRTDRANQSSQRNAMAWPISVFESRSSRG
jgi:hypothetical protein